MRWQVALGITPLDAHCCQKTLHNFRAKLLGNERACLFFQDMTRRLVEKLALSTGTQRLDSTHIRSNIAHLSRLGLFCEVVRNFLRELKKTRHPVFDSIPAKVRNRYINEKDGDTAYQDAKSSESRRRLQVCARDLYRLIELAQHDPEAASLESFRLLQRNFSE